MENKFFCVSATLHFSCCQQVKFSTRARLSRACGKFLKPLSTIDFDHKSPTGNASYSLWHARGMKQRTILKDVFDSGNATRGEREWLRTRYAEQHAKLAYSVSFSECSTSNKSTKSVLSPEVAKTHGNVFVRRPYLLKVYCNSLYGAFLTAASLGIAPSFSDHSYKSPRLRLKAAQNLCALPPQYFPHVARAAADIALTIRNGGGEWTHEQSAADRIFWKVFAQALSAFGTDTLSPAETADLLTASATAANAGAPGWRQKYRSEHEVMVDYLARTVELNMGSYTPRQIVVALEALWILRQQLAMPAGCLISSGLLYNKGSTSLLSETSPDHKLLKRSAAEKMVRLINVAARLLPEKLRKALAAATRASYAAAAAAAATADAADAHQAKFLNPSLESRGKRSALSHVCELIVRSLAVLADVAIVNEAMLQPIGSIVIEALGYMDVSGLRSLLESAGRLQWRNVEMLNRLNRRLTETATFRTLSLQQLAHLLSVFANLDIRATEAVAEVEKALAEALSYCKASEGPNGQTDILKSTDHAIAKKFLHAKTVLALIMTCKEIDEDTKQKATLLFGEGPAAEVARLVLQWRTVNERGQNTIDKCVPSPHTCAQFLDAITRLGLLRSNCLANLAALMLHPVNSCCIQPAHLSMLLGCFSSMNFQHYALWELLAEQIKCFLCWNERARETAACPQLTPTAAASDMTSKKYSGHVDSGSSREASQTGIDVQQRRKLLNRTSPEAFLISSAAVRSHYEVLALAACALAVIRTDMIYSKKRRCRRDMAHETTCVRRDSHRKHTNCGKAFNKNNDTDVVLTEMYDFSYAKQMKATWCRGLLDFLVHKACGDSALMVERLARDAAAILYLNRLVHKRFAGTPTRQQQSQRYQLLCKSPRSKRSNRRKGARKLRQDRALLEKHDKAAFPGLLLGKQSSEDARLSQAKQQLATLFALLHEKIPTYHTSLRFFCDPQRSSVAARASLGCSIETGNDLLLHRKMANLTEKQRMSQNIFKPKAYEVALDSLEEDLIVELLIKLAFSRLSSVKRLDQWLPQNFILRLEDVYFSQEAVKATNEPLRKYDFSLLEGNPRLANNDIDYPYNVLDYETLVVALRCLLGQLDKPTTSFVEGLAKKDFSTTARGQSMRANDAESPKADLNHKSHSDNELPTLSCISEKSLCADVAELSPTLGEVSERSCNIVLSSTAASTAEAPAKKCAQWLQYFWPFVQNILQVDCAVLLLMLRQEQLQLAYAARNARPSCYKVSAAHRVYDIEELLPVRVLRSWLSDVAVLVQTQRQLCARNFKY